MKIAAIIEARMTSSRLPGKIVRPIMGRPTLELLIERLLRSRYLNSIVIATTSNDTDDATENLAKRLRVGCYRGSEDDVLDRVLKAAQTYNIDVIVEITGDCPLIDPAVIDKLLAIYLEGDYDFVANTLKETYPNGLDTRIFSRKILEDVAELTQDPVDHEHVSLYIFEHPERYNLFNMESNLPEKFWGARLTVDTIEDFEVISRIFEELYPKKPAFSLEDIINLLERRPELLEINREIKQKEVR